MSIIFLCSIICISILAALILGISLYYNRSSEHLKRPLSSAFIFMYSLISSVLLIASTNIVFESKSRSLQSDSTLMSESIKLMGHESINENTNSDDPKYLDLIALQIKWNTVADRVFDDVYIMKKNSNNKVYFTVDSETDYDKSGGYEEDRETRTDIGEIYEKEISELEYTFKTADYSITRTYYTDKWGTWISAFYPVFDKKAHLDAVIGVDIDVKNMILKIVWPQIPFVLVIAIFYISLIFYRKNLFTLAKLEETLKNQLQSTQETLLRQKQFLATMSHEIRTPLNGILGAISLVEGSQFSKENEQYFKIISSSSQMLADIVGDVLDYSKIEFGKLNLEKRKLKISELLENVRFLFDIQMKTKNLNFIIQMDDKIKNCYYSADEVRLKQIIVNFVSNAYKFTQQGSISIFVRVVKSESFKSVIEFRVIDTGIGISFENEKKLFKAFNQADSTITRKYGGTGLGLVISKHLIEAMGGQVVFKSTPGLGTTFVFTVELENIELSASEVAVNKTSKEQQLEVFSELSILVVDDVVVNQIVLKKMLEKLGLTCDLAANGLEAFEMTIKNKYNIIFMDCQMPVMDGYVATEKIRLHQRTQDTQSHIIAVTANASVEDKEKCFKSGVDQFVSKPLTLQQVQSTLHNVIVSKVEQRQVS